MFGRWARALRPFSACDFVLFDSFQGSCTIFDVASLAKHCSAGFGSNVSMLAMLVWIGQMVWQRTIIKEPKR